MLKSPLNIFSSSECKDLKNILKDPEDNFQKLILLLEKKIIERTKLISESEKKYRSLITVLTNIGFGIDIISKDHEILYQNQVLKEKFGDNLEELCFEKYMGEKSPCDFCQMEHTLKYDEVKRNELKVNKLYTTVTYWTVPLHFFLLFVLITLTAFNKLTFEQLKIYFALVETAFGAYVGIIISSLFKTDDQFLIRGDSSLRNFMFTDRIWGVDFEESRIGSPVEDIGRVAFNGF